MSDNNFISLYLLYDRVSMVFSPCRPAINDAVAVRMFKSELKHPELLPIAGDMDLYKLGELDTRTGEFKYADETEKPVFLYRFSEVENDG